MAQLVTETYSFENIIMSLLISVDSWNCQCV